MRPVHALLPLLLTVFLVASCTHNVDPKVTPAKIPGVQPPIQSRAVLLITPSFESYATQASNGFHRWNYQLGKSATAALTDMVAQSFLSGETQRLTDAELVGRLSAAADTGRADLLLVPYFEAGEVRERVFDAVAETRLRLNVRCLRTGKTFAWAAAGRSARAVSSQKGLTGSALEQALRALSDSLAAHRLELEDRQVATQEP